MNNVAWRLDLLQENAEQLEGAWIRRLRAERSPSLDVDGLDRLDRQIVAHADALALAGAQAGPILDGLFAARNPAAAAAAALVIGWGDGPAMVPRLLAAFAAAGRGSGAGWWWRSSCAPAVYCWMRWPRRPGQLHHVRTWRRGPE